jgi:hypothetical protein
MATIYKIMKLERDDRVKPLYSPIMTKVEQANNTFVWEEWSTEDETVLNQKMVELVKEGGTARLRPYIDVQYELDIIIPVS